MRRLPDRREPKYRGSCSGRLSEHSKDLSGRYCSTIPTTRVRQATTAACNREPSGRGHSWSLGPTGIAEPTRAQ